MEKYLKISEEVKEALATGKPVIALESTIISHGMPYPQNVETALKVESHHKSALKGWIRIVCKRSQYWRGAGLIL